MKTLVLLSLLIPSFGFFGGEDINTHEQTKRIMVIPFFDNNYLCDDNPELVETNGMSASQISFYFKDKLSGYIAGALEDARYIKKNIYLHQSDSIFGSIGYKFEAPFNKMEKKSSPLDKVKGFIKKKSTPTKEESYYERYSGQSRVDDDYFVNAIIKEQETIDSIHSRLDIDKFLIVNQLEIHTDYYGAQDRSTKEFERIIKVHFTLVDEKGRAIAGDKVIFNYPSNSRDVNALVKDCFPEIAIQIVGKIWN